MSEFMFGITRQKPKAGVAKQWEKICLAEGGYGYTEITEADGRYLGWFVGPNRGYPDDDDLARRVLSRCAYVD